MIVLQIDVSDDVRHRLQARAMAEGFSTIEEYAKAILRSSVAENLLDDQTEPMLLRRLEDPRPSLECDTAFQEQFKNDVKRRRQNEKKGT